MQAFALRRTLLVARRTRPTVNRHVAPVQRWTRFQATVATSRPAASSFRCGAEATLKRFWKTVGIEQREGALTVTLDKRTLKTPSGNPLLIPETKALAATLIAVEWENQETLLKQHSLPMTSLASRAIDAFQDEVTRGQVRGQLLKYLQTDTICFHSSDPESLVSLQQTHWVPVLEWASSTFNVEISTATDSFVIPPHPEATIKKFDQVLSTFDPWQMAAMERATYSSKSFLIGLALTLRHITAEEASLASHVEVNSQIEKWGEVEDSHDVDYHDIRRQLASAACLISTL
ncbi:ATP12-domain-containing protein [Irpex rosettiformis]|uniref:ATP12-domain-containing protein n=1 Tax=Irpex rosettiformis TaxID=378272 RepID=A0ACB8TX81_9APHY|nr:ATP12-domain-containing protein [Irpex rosettiformis]